MSSQGATECCMCGDHGIPYELFRCKVCLFRSQHSYCSDLYPKAESYRVCNWCQKKKEGQIEGTQNPSPSSAYNNNYEDNNKNKKKNDSNINGNEKIMKKGTLQLHVNNIIKKQRSLERLPSARKKITSTDFMVDETLRRTKSEEISNPGIITKQVFKGKLRRYKLLDEVSR